ncbi:MAG TPA: phosphoribosylformylglycinamidine synthase subunit PurL [Candidatus Krumholzibacteria bacterium]|nr:phosphoribosylformylglycinamidine synthase subunit PurL [Candidatus Krumholzibacteria bacterium]HRX52351.1 phosphoribosylformylglycinamidine synthase subunit PurL [Candidatus Krumholzibacteria bacterium]
MHDSSFDQLDTSALDDAALRGALKAHALTLSCDEARRVQELLGRAPTVTELTLFDTMWSEHCSYKSSKPTLKEFLPTDASNVIVGPVEDAGIVDFGTVDGVRYGIIFAHESHNHPSQVMPVEGAATGIGGIVRDVYCMGGEVIGTLDPLRFGWPQGEKGAHSVDIAREVVTGIWEYGNALGVPNLGGDVYFHPSFDDNCLVNVVALGIVPVDHITHSRVPARAADEPYDLIMVGKPTDWSGMGGAAFASATLDADAATENKGSVQVPDPFLKRVLTVANQAVLARARERGAEVGFKDLGAGGVSCVTSELADAGGFGCDVDLALVHQIPDCPARVVACSETQERYGLAVPAWFTDDVLRIYNEDFALPSLYEGACARKVGVVTTDGMYRLHHGERMAAEAPIATITCGVSYAREEAPAKAPSASAPKAAEAPDAEIAAEWVRLLGHVNAASREHLFRHYDPEVRGCTVLRPGEADAGVVAPVPGSPLGVAVSADGNPLVGEADAYQAGARAVIEAARNVACVGGRPAAVTDCLNFGNPEVPEVFRQFREAVRGVGDACRGLTLHARGGEALPVVSGNVSFYNQSAAGRTVAPSPIVACVANVADVSRARSSHFKEAAGHLLLVGFPTADLGATLAREAGLAAGTDRLPALDYEAARREIDAVCSLVEQGLVRAAHDVSDGGLAVALAEMALGLEGHARLGAQVRIPNACAHLTPREFLYGERGGFVLEVDARAAEAAGRLLSERGVEWAVLGRVTSEPSLVLRDVQGGEVAKVALADVELAWRDGLTRVLATRTLPDLPERLPVRGAWDDHAPRSAPAVLTGAAPRVAVLQLPGMNCEVESARAVEAAGGRAEIYRWTRSAADLAAFDGFLVPGGFSYQDRVRAGAVAAKDPLLGALQTAAAAGKPILGICNGCQVLVEAGLVPGRSGLGTVEVALAPNRIPGRRGYFSRWVVLEPVAGSRCRFLDGLPASVPVPIAHAEGRFTHEDPAEFAALAAEGYLAFRYLGADGADHGRGNPNGSLEACAALTNPGGNVLAMMPHPERAAWLFQVPEDLDHPWGGVRRGAAGDAAALTGPGPGLALLARLVELC